MRLKKILLLTILLPLLTAAQDKPTADELLLRARQTAFDQKNYPGAIRLCRQALEGSPGYTDIRVFLGRLYFWNDQADSARFQLDKAVKDDPSHEDAAVAAASVAFFTDQYDNCIAYCDGGLKHHPQSHDLLLQKAKCLTAMRRYKDAVVLTDTLLGLNKNDADARDLAFRIKDFRAANKIGISYDYTHFSRQFDQAWHLISVDYTRQTAIGSFTGRVNYTNRFGEGGYQFEVDGYPSIARNLYAYLNLGYSPDMPLFPKYRAGFSLYASLPRSFEADAGFRYLNFDNDTWIYTGSIGKYYKNWWFNLRAYITPDDHRISQSYSLTARYYLGGADDYLAASAGTGISPDDRSQANLLNSNYKLTTRRVNASYRFSYKKLNIFSIGVGYANVEYLPKTRDNQLNANVLYQRRF
jgi:YaiO family outer membrane protein